VATRRRGRLARLGRALALALAAWAALTVATVVALRWLDPPTTAFMLRDRVGALLRAEEGYEFRHDWRDWDQISKYAPLAVVAAEDQRFPQHRGFDFAQIDKALADRERGRRVRGASTISQQVAKNLFLWPGQSWFRKGLEAGITVLIEFAWPKRRILEVYLNVAEFGRGTWGVQAASRRYFGKDAARLTRAEAARLAAVLPAPKRYRVDAPGPYVRKRQAWIERQMVALGGPAYLADLR
jgi:monofunctional biosynthetic peptidoglycan transglycosylase